MLSVLSLQVEWRPDGLDEGMGKARADRFVAVGCGPSGLTQTWVKRGCWCVVAGGGALVGGCFAECAEDDEGEDGCESKDDHGFRVSLLDLLVQVSGCEGCGDAGQHHHGGEGSDYEECVHGFLFSGRLPAWLPDSYEVLAFAVLFELPDGRGLAVVGGGWVDPRGVWRMARRVGGITQRC